MPRWSHTSCTLCSTFSRLAEGHEIHRFQVVLLWFEGNWSSLTCSTFGPLVIGGLGRERRTSRSPNSVSPFGKGLFYVR